MVAVEGARTFVATGQAYDGFMGRYSHPLAVEFATFAQVAAGQRALDVGCGPGALARELSRRLGLDAVAACDPSASFLAACAQRNPGLVVRRGSAEHLPFGNDEFDLAIAQLVLHFVSDTEGAATEMKRVLRPQGTIAACVWDFSQGMQMLRAFWDAALTVDPEAPDEQRVMRFGRAGEIAQWLADAHLDDVTESTLTVSSTYQDFDELWSGFLAGIGPSGSYCVGLPPTRRQALRSALHDRLGAPTGPFTLEAVARAGRGTRR
jgi:ubiquinone/menaquinone biosynthesis C-methylase UbiE